MQEAIAAPQIGGMVELTGFIIKTSLIVETAGAVLLMPVFIKISAWEKAFGILFFIPFPHFVMPGLI